MNQEMPQVSRTSVLFQFSILALSLCLIFLFTKETDRRFRDAWLTAIELHGDMNRDEVLSLFLSLHDVTLFQHHSDVHEKTDENEENPICLIWPYSFRITSLKITFSEDKIASIFTRYRSGGFRELPDDPVRSFKRTLEPHYTLYIFDFIFIYCAVGTIAVFFKIIKDIVRWSLTWQPYFVFACFLFVFLLFAPYSMLIHLKWW